MDIVLYSGWFVAVPSVVLNIYQYTIVRRLEARITTMEKTIKEVIGAMENK